MEEELCSVGRSWTERRHGMGGGGKGWDGTTEDHTWASTHRHIMVTHTEQGERDTQETWTGADRSLIMGLSPIFTGK